MKNYWIVLNPLDLLFTSWPRTSNPTKMCKTDGKRSHIMTIFKLFSILVFIIAN